MKSCVKSIGKFLEFSAHKMAVHIINKLTQLKIQTDINIITKNNIDKKP